MAFQGSLRELPLPDIIQLVAVSGKTGVFVLRNGAQTGKIYLEKGQIVHADVVGMVGEQAVYELARWLQGDFVFTPGAEAEARTVDKSNTNLLMEAARQIDEWKILSKKIESTRLVPVFTPQSTGTSVSFSSAEWALITRVDERRNIEEIAAALGHGAFEVCKVVYGLLTSGVLSLREDLRGLPFDRVQSLGVDGQVRVAEQIHDFGKQQLAGSDRSEELESAWRLGRAEIGFGRGGDAVQSLVRSEEKLISSALGPNQAKAFLERVAQILQAS